MTGSTLQLAAGTPQMAALDTTYVIQVLAVSSANEFCSVLSINYAAAMANSKLCGFACVLAVSPACCALIGSPRDNYMLLLWLYGP